MSAGVGLHLAPALTSIAPLRRRLAPRLAGISRRRHIALTYDDGPDSASTPRFLELLEEFDVSATFFLLGEHVVGEPDLVRAMAAAGFELGVHGWNHTCLATMRPGHLAGELRKTRETIEDLAQTPVRWYRPPYGVFTVEGLAAARHAGLTPVLWSAWGCDWTARATPASITRTVQRAIRPGGTVLLHDSDRTSAPGSWGATLVASRELLSQWRTSETPVGPLREHW